MEVTTFRIHMWVLYWIDGWFKFVFNRLTIWGRTVQHVPKLYKSIKECSPTVDPTYPHGLSNERMSGRSPCPLIAVDS